VICIESCVSPSNKQLTFPYLSFQVKKMSESDADGQAKVGDVGASA